MADVSIIIPAYNEATELPNLVASIRREMDTQPEIVVVDNGSDDGTAEVGRRLGCRVVETPNKLYPSAARNYGARHCHSPLFVFLDADVIVTTRWARTVERLAKDPQFIGSRSATGDSCHISETPSWIERFWFEPLRRNGRTFLNGANMIISRKAFEATGGFNAELETGEDVEFSERAMRMGVDLELNPKLIVHHEGFPKDLRNFFEREKWHGVGDFSSLAYFMRSKVAQLVAVIGLCYLTILLFLPLAIYGGAAYAKIAVLTCLAVIPGICIASSLAKFWKVGPVYCLVGSFIYFIYFNARLASMVVSLKKHRSSRWSKQAEPLHDQS